MARREELQMKLQEADKLLALSARAIRRQELMIRWLEFERHAEVAETAKRVHRAFMKADAAQVARQHKILIDLVCSQSRGRGR